ncbi:acyl-CoA dehydrogenase family protein [Streptomyces sp. NPDC056269]|uniref:acyl-CoA dehydrogenase family protein n=1 Tax=Streptomyces sp. NPDC056269 TaxID=3345768 RepID=UPI0035DE9647
MSTVRRSRVWCATGVTKGAHAEIQASKIAIPATVQRILDKAIQLHGDRELSRDFAPANMYAHIRTLRFADGPDEVHKNALAKSELRGQGTRGACMTDPPGPCGRDAAAANACPEGAGLEAPREGHWGGVALITAGGLPIEVGAA